MEDIYTSVVIVAAGKGKRMNINQNKQFINIDGIPVLARSILKFEKVENVNEIVVVVAQDEVDYCNENIIGKYNFKKVKKVIAGGVLRQNSVFNGLKECFEHTDIVLVHDGARPFISTSVIENVINETKLSKAVVVAVPVKDTIKAANSDLLINSTLDRSILWAIQTPQAFDYKLLLEAHKKAIESRFNGTDDAMLVENIGNEVRIVPGDYYNIKVTTKEDILIANTFAIDGL